MASESPVYREMRTMLGYCLAECLTAELVAPDFGPGQKARVDLATDAEIFADRKSLHFSVKLVRFETEPLDIFDQKMVMQTCTLYISLSLPSDQAKKSDRPSSIESVNACSLGANPGMVDPMCDNDLIEFSYFDLLMVNGQVADKPGGSWLVRWAATPEALGVVREIWPDIPHPEKDHNIFRGNWQAEISPDSPVVRERLCQLIYWLAK